MTAQLITPITLPRAWQDALILLPRIVCGIMLAFFFGAPKFGMPWSPADSNLGFWQVAFWFPSDVAAFGGPFAWLPEFFAWMGAFSEAVGGLMIIIGLGTRIFAFLNVCTMLVAMFGQQWQNGYWNMLPAAGFMWVCFFLCILGSGRFGVDYWLSKNINHRVIDKVLKISLLGGLILLPFLSKFLVQPIYHRTVVLKLNTAGAKNIETVGVRGGSKPLSWQEDFVMKLIVKDSLYTAIIQGKTGYAAAEFKFTINGKFELENQENRKVYFKGDTTYYEAVFDQIK